MNITKYKSFIILLILFTCFLCNEAKTESNLNFEVFLDESDRQDYNRLDKCVNIIRQIIEIERITSKDLSEFYYGLEKDYEFKNLYKFYNLNHKTITFKEYIGFLLDYEKNLKRKKDIDINYLIVNIFTEYLYDDVIHILQKTDFSDQSRIECFKNKYGKDYLLIEGYYNNFIRAYSENHNIKECREIGKLIKESNGENIDERLKNKYGDLNWKNYKTFYEYEQLCYKRNKKIQNNILLEKFPLDKIELKTYILEINSDKFFYKKNINALYSYNDELFYNEDITRDYITINNNAEYQIKNYNGLLASRKTICSNYSAFEGVKVIPLKIDSKGIYFMASTGKFKETNDVYLLPWGGKNLDGPFAKVKNEFYENKYRIDGRLMSPQSGTTKIERKANWGKNSWLGEDSDYFWVKNKYKILRISNPIVVGVNDKGFTDIAFIRLQSYSGILGIDIDWFSVNEEKDNTFSLKHINYIREEADKDKKFPFDNIFIGYGNIIEGMGKSWIIAKIKNSQNPITKKKSGVFSATILKEDHSIKTEFTIPIPYCDGIAMTDIDNDGFLDFVGSGDLSDEDTKNTVIVIKLKNPSAKPNITPEILKSYASSEIDSNNISETQNTISENYDDSELEKKNTKLNDKLDNLKNNSRNTNLDQSSKPVEKEVKTRDKKEESTFFTIFNTIYNFFLICGLVLLIVFASFIVYIYFFHKKKITNDSTLNNNNFNNEESTDANKESESSNDDSRIKENS